MSPLSIEHARMILGLVVSLPGLLDNLSDDEVASLHMHALADWPTDGMPYHRHVCHLYTEEGGRRMHASVKAALDRAVAGRLDPSMAGSR